MNLNKFIDRLFAAFAVTMLVAIWLLIAFGVWAFFHGAKLP